MRCVMRFVLCLCAVAGLNQVVRAQAMNSDPGNLGAGGGFAYWLNGNWVGIGALNGPNYLPTPGNYGPYITSYDYAGASWQSSWETGWSLANTATTTDVSGFINLYASVDQGTSGATVLNQSSAAIALIFHTTQTVAFTANWYNSISGPTFSPGTFQVNGPFSSYPAAAQPTFAPQTFSGVLAPGTHIIGLQLSLDVQVPAGVSINDAIGIGFDLHTEIVPEPCGLLSLACVALVAARRRL